MDSQCLNKLPPLGRQSGKVFNETRGAPFEGGPCQASGVAKVVVNVHFSKRFHNQCIADVIIGLDDH
jgi:hypothetical protein